MKSVSYGDYLRFRDLAFAQSGLHFPEKKRDDLELGLRKALLDAPAGIDNLDAYYRLLQDANNPLAQAELARLINILTVGETYFFRDEAQMEALSTAVLPSIIKAKRQTAVDSGGVPHLSIWSAGCSSGEEPYSIAILLREAIPDIDKWRLRIIGSDINQDALDRARKALYSDWSFREPRAQQLRSVYFLPDGKKYRLCNDIKKMVRFTQHNLIEDRLADSYTNFDLIICRNVTIYFASETTQRLANKFYNALRGQGWLIVGHAEPSSKLYGAFDARTFPGAIFYQKNGRTTAKTKRRSVRQLSLPDTGILSPPANGRLHPSPPPTPSVAALKEELTQMPEAYHPHIYSALARAYADQGDWEEARACCEEAISRDSLLGDAYFVLALIEEHEGELEKAIAQLKKVIYLDPQRPFAQFNLGMLYNKMGYFAQARRALSNARNLLTNYAPTDIIPDSGDATAERLLTVIERMQQ